MVNVSFDEERTLQNATGRPEVRHRGFAGFLVKIGVVQNEGQANILLVLLAIVAIALAVYIYTQGQPVERVPTAEEKALLLRMNGGLQP